MGELEQLIERHRGNGLFVDSNLTLLYLVGKTNRQRIASFKRTQTFVEEDFDLLCRIVDQFQKLFSTPHVLTEVSNLATLKGRELLEFRKEFKVLAERATERYHASSVVASDAFFPRLGLTDAAIGVLSSLPLMFLTVDLDLHLALQSRGADSVNFNHVRPLYWR